MASIYSHSWPTVLKEDQITLRPLRLRDRSAWLAVRKVNRTWLSQWEATSPLNHENKNLPSYFEMVNYHRGEGRAGRSLTLAIWFEKNLIGQITLGESPMAHIAGDISAIGLMSDMPIKG